MRLVVGKDNNNKTANSCAPLTSRRIIRQFQCLKAYTQPVYVEIVSEA
jgi:hypothetical protein